MADLSSLAQGIVSGSISVIDLTAPLNPETPVLVLPEPWGQTAKFSSTEISNYDERGPWWYWNNFSTGEHTGTHLDAPNHWISGKDLDDVSQIPPQRLVGPAVVLDFVAHTQADPDFLLDVTHIKEWEATHGKLPSHGWVLFRTGWSSRGNAQDTFLNADETGPHTPGLSIAAANYLAHETDILGLGVETVGTDAGQAFGFETPFPCHANLMGANKYGLTQLRNLDKLPTTGAVVIAAPLKIEKGSGSPTRVLALVSK
ncbi:unannotated protein [freshwater metagenome]|uniref:Unannotated protein n=1 Tax=freshwater metagenome TaxID=449393 RepID=A0A6J7BGC4_9ZZZZ|nr:cyclase family protein [Actinomycetota bacterium]MSY51336.1 cyclase family protein [Actinomycetota bacterium]MSY88231.1 cyclase family protein [Actinomycetota bacterium]MTA51483.1 cyclase family protein [Actinomycetota bacterium]